METVQKQVFGSPKDRKALIFVGVSFILAGMLVMNTGVDSPILDIIIIGTSIGLIIGAVKYYRTPIKDNKWKPTKSNWREEFR